MIQLEISGVHFELDDKLKLYVSKKIGKLDRYVPKQARQPIKGHVVLTEQDGVPKNRFSCEVTLTLPHEVVTAKDATINMYAAVDITEAKIKAQLVRYKSKYTQHHPRGARILRRLRQITRLEREE